VIAINWIEKTFPESFVKDLPHPWLVIEDAHENIDGVLEHLLQYMQTGDYFIVEDTSHLLPTHIAAGSTIFHSQWMWSMCPCIHVSWIYWRPSSRSTTRNMLSTPSSLTSSGPGTGMATFTVCRVWLTQWTHTVGHACGLHIAVVHSKNTFCCYKSNVC